MSPLGKKTSAEFSSDFGDEPSHSPHIMEDGDIPEIQNSFLNWEGFLCEIYKHYSYRILLLCLKIIFFRYSIMIVTLFVIEYISLLILSFWLLNIYQPNMGIHCQKFYWWKPRVNCGHVSWSQTECNNLRGFNIDPSKNTPIPVEN